MCIFLGLRTQKLTAPMRRLLALSVVYFGLIAISAADQSLSKKAYDDFDSLVTEFSKKNCPFNRRIFTILEEYYSVELRIPKTGETCVVQPPQIPCHECVPCQACICPYCPPVVITSTEQVTTQQVILFFYVHD